MSDSVATLTPMQMFDQLLIGQLQLMGTVNHAAQLIIKSLVGDINLYTLIEQPLILYCMANMSCSIAT